MGYLKQHWKHCCMPVVCDNYAFLTRAEWQSSQSFYGRLVEQYKALLIVRVVCPRSLTIKLAACLAPDLRGVQLLMSDTADHWFLQKLVFERHLGQERFIVNPDSVNTILLGVEVTNFLTIYVPGDACIPSVCILVVSARPHWCSVLAAESPGQHMDAWQTDQTTDPSSKNPQKPSTLVLWSSRCDHAEPVL